MSVNSEWLNEIFNIPTDGSNINNSSDEDEVQDNAFTEIGKGTYNDSYTEKIASLNKSIPPSSEANDFDFVDSNISLEETNKKEIVIDNKNVQEQTRISKEIENKTEEQPSSSEVVHEQTDDNKNVEQEENDESENASRNVLELSSHGEEDSEGWVLTCNSPKLKKFYEHKISKINRLRSIGLIPFDKYQEELKQAFVPIWNPTDDTSVVNHKIKMISDWRNRVTYITLEVDPQLTWWSMVIEHLQGLLALNQYEKPKERQIGMHYIHLRDVEDYLSKLKGLKMNCSSVMSNLDKAYDSLSRQITVIMPQKEMERYGNNNSSSLSNTQKMTEKQEENYSDALKDFDSLNNNVKSEKPYLSKTISNSSPTKTGKVSWGDIKRK